MTPRLAARRDEAELAEPDAVALLEALTAKVDELYAAVARLLAKQARFSRRRAKLTAADRAACWRC